MSTKTKDRAIQRLESALDEAQSSIDEAMSLLSDLEDKEIKVLKGSHSIDTGRGSISYSCNNLQDQQLMEVLGKLLATNSKVSFQYLLHTLERLEV